MMIVMMHGSPPRCELRWSNATASYDRRASRRCGRTEPSAAEPLTWRPLAVSAACALVVAGIVWKSTDRPARIDPSLAHELSSADYWRVPTDELLAYEAAPLRADLPSPTGLQISLEESLL